MLELGQKMCNNRELIGTRHLLNMKTTVVFSDDKIQLDLQILSKFLTSCPQSAEDLMTEIHVLH